MAKLAAGSGDGNDTSYEQALSDLADVVIKDRAPALQQYAVGFQLLDRDDDNNKAVGVKAFKVGKFWLFVPVFLLNGRVKGTELLYIKNQDIFVPLQDDWVRYVLNKQTQEMGRGVSRNLSQLGISTPDLRQITRPPTKFAADLPAVFAEGMRLFRKEVLPRWAKCACSDPFGKVTYSLPDFLKEAGRPAVLALYRMVEDCPRLWADVEKYHGDAVLKAAGEVAARREPAPGPARPLSELLDRSHPLKSGSLQVYTYDQRLGPLGDLLDEFRPSERGDVRDGPVIRDERKDEDVSVAYDAPHSLVNPDETGIYDVLTRPLEYERCLVVVKPRMLRGRWQAALVVRLSDKAYVAVHPTKVWVGRKYEDPEWKDFLEGLPEAGKSLEERKDVDSAPIDVGDTESKENRTRTIFVGPDHDATAPLYAYGALGDSDGGTTYKIHFDTRREDVGPDSYGHTHMTTNQLRSEEYWGGSGMPAQLALGTSRGSKLWVAEQTMYVPDGYRRLTVTHPAHDAGVLQLGSPYHVTMGIVRKLPRLKVSFARDGVRVNGRAFDEDGALVHLVAGHGLRADAAREVLKRASDRRYKADPEYACYVKYAGPYLYESQPGAPPFPDPYMTEEPTLSGSVPAMPAQQFATPVQDMRPDPGALAGYDIRQPSPALMQHVQDAAASGQKEVFDTSMIGSLLQSTQQDLQVDRFLGPLMTGLDALARIMMALFWHDDDFAERYGKDDVVSLEDMLRNTFINLGKLILNLKQRGVEDPLDTQRDLELTTASEQ